METDVSFKLSHFAYLNRLLIKAWVDPIAKKQNASNKVPIFGVVASEVDVWLKQLVTVEEKKFFAIPITRND